MIKIKKGFSIVECVVAISVITLITGIALSVYGTTLRTIDRQWDNYLASVMENNALASFQGSEDMESFQKNLDMLSEFGSQSEQKVDILVKESYSEMSLAMRQKLPLPFSKIRANESDNTVSFYGDGENVLFSLVYNDHDKYSSEKSFYLDDANGLYEILSQKNGEAGYTSVTVKLYY